MQPITSSGGYLPTCTFTREGYAFTGWGTDPSNGGTYPDKGYFKPTSDTTLYARWGTPKASVTTDSGTTTDYATIVAALDAAPANSTITLKDDAELTESLYVNQKITLDLNGYNITTNMPAAAAGPFLTVYDSLTIKDSGTNGSISHNGNFATIINCRELVIEDGTIENTGTKYAIELVGYTGQSMSLLVKGGKIKAKVSAIHTDASDTSITVTGGTITSETGNAISGSDNLIISGGTITSTQNYAINYCNKLTLSGAPVISGKNADIRFSYLNLQSSKSIIAGKLEMKSPLKITDGEEKTRYYPSYNTVFTAGEGYTITQEDVNKLKFVDSTGADYKWTSSSATETLIFKLDSNKKAIVIGESN